MRWLSRARLPGSLLSLSAALWATMDESHSAPAAGIYSCVDSSGKRITSDRPIPECSAREQRVLNRDGSVRQVMPPSMSSEERADHEARQRERAQAEVAQRDAVRRDRNLVLRYPDAKTHQKARAAALDDVEKAIQRAERRLSELVLERKPLNDEAEFYVGRQMPANLKLKIEANDASRLGVQTLIQNHRAEQVRINALYDDELGRLRRLWSGAALGSVGAQQVPASTPPARGTAATKP
jgi:hypothetical protein